MKTIFLTYLLFFIPLALFSQEIKDFKGIKISAYIISGITENLKIMQSVESIQIRTDNYEALQSDIAVWGKITGNKVRLIEKTGENLLFEITKTTENSGSGKSLSMIISDKGLEELLSPLGFAVSAALSGYKVNIYFQGPAVKVLEKGFKEKLKGINSVFSAFARNGLAKIGHSAAQDKLRILEQQGAVFYICQPSMDHFNLKKENIAFSNIILCEYFTFLEKLEQSDIQFFLQ